MMVVRKNITTILILLTAILGVAVIYRLPTFTGEDGTRVISEKPLPATFVGKEMIAYQSEYGYTITYPKEWVAFDSTDYDNTQGVGSKPRLISGFNINPKSLNLDPEIDYVPGSMFKILVTEVYIVPEIERNAVFNGHDAVWNSDEQFGGEYFDFEKNDLKYSLQFRFNEAYGITREEAEYVLSTFKFTD